MLVDLWEFWWKKMSAVDSIIILNLTPRLTSTIGHKSEQTRFLDFLNFFMSCRRRFWHYLINRSDSKRHLWSFWAAWKDQLAAQIWHFLNMNFGISAKSPWPSRYQICPFFNICDQLLDAINIAWALELDRSVVIVFMILYMFSKCKFIGKPNNVMQIN